ncbi:dipicolinate synthase subunit DpsA [Phosphitispora sp. TUW77]|uniref:dipicolinate synthase subunit DpsA n=1 Tax=Phosphitispora sp. TUW77 TaxID=3152361 RepID=UPI003AB1B4C8
MSSILAGVSVAVLGGDDRELILAPHLAQLGANVRVAGITKLIGNNRIQYCESAGEAVNGARFVILPMSGIDEQGYIRARYAQKHLSFTRDVIKFCKDDCTIIVGFARQLLKQLIAERGLGLVEIAGIDEVAIMNSIPSAEGALQMAMEATDITIHGSNTIVFGFGRCGCTLARMLSALGAITSVVARKPADHARITEMGMEPMSYSQLPGYIERADIIFNTVPSLVLDESLLRQTKPAVFICDIASAPGGVDFKAAENLGRNAVLAPGLPGKVAPRTAAMILAKVIPDIIVSELANTSSLFSTKEDRG